MAHIKNPAIKRIHADVRELMKEPSDQYHAAPLESNLFEWHFTIRGPPDTEFEGGVYHGRILLPPEYPFRPPDIVFTTPNGRFNVGVKICLTISSYHPEHWQPAWGIRLILEALISFFPSPSHGALGGLDWNAEERKRLAVASNEWKCYKCGLAQDLVPELRPEGSSRGGSGGAVNYAEQIKELHKLKAKTAEEVDSEKLASSTAAGDGGGGGDGDGGGGGGGGGSSDSGAIADGGDNGVGVAARAEATNPPRTQGDPSSSSTQSNRGESRAASKTTTVTEACDGGARTGVSPNPDGTSRGAASLAGDGEGEVAERNGGEGEGEDDMLSFFAVAIVLAIVGILIRKGLRHLEFL